MVPKRNKGGPHGAQRPVALDDPASVEWFSQEVLMNQTEDGALYLHSNEVGDTVGRVRVLVVHDWPPRSDTPTVLVTGQGGAT